MKNVVFFSRYKKDTYSPRLLAFMKNMPFRREFAYYCIDPHPVTRKRNDELLELLDVTEVPTLYVNGQKFVGEEAFSWLREQAELLQQREHEPQTDYYDDYRYQQPPTRHEEIGPLQQPHAVPSHPGGVSGMLGFASTATGGRPPNRTPQHEEPELAAVGGGDSAYANPFADPLGNGQSQQYLAPPIETKNQDSSARMDEELKRLAMERKSLMPPDGPSGGLPGFGGRSMQDLQIPLRR